MRLLVVNHDHLTRCGPLGERFADHGFDVDELLVVPPQRFTSPGVEADFPPPTGADVVLVMGAPWSAYDVDSIGTWVLPEQEWLREADRARVPVLGVCFGGQLLAAAHGGAARRSAHPEIGWRAITSDSPRLVPAGRWFQWHFDTWELPAGARELARNAAASQAFVLRRNLAVQFHPELVASTLGLWLGAGGAAQAEARGIDTAALLAQTEALQAEARVRAHRLVDGFLDEVAHAPA